MSVARAGSEFNWPEEQPPPSGPAYPIGLSIREYKPARRLWAIPIVGFLAKLAVLLPHLVCLVSLGWLAGFFLYWYWGTVVLQLFSGALFASHGALGAAGLGFIVLAAAQLVLWVWVLFDGRYPGWGTRLVGGCLAWWARAAAFWLGLTDQYPPFSTDLNPADGDTDVQVSIAVPGHSNRGWAIPVAAIWFKLALLLPHFVCLAVLGMVCAIAYFILWIPVLISGRYPSWGYTLLGGTMRWGTRVNAYLFGLTDAYPPFAVD